MTHQLDLKELSISQDIETQQLTARYAAVLLWSTPVVQPGCEGEATEFYAATLIALIDAWGVMSNHGKLSFLAAAHETGETVPDIGQPLLGDYDVA